MTSVIDVSSPIQALPRVALGNWPTPFERLNRLSADLGIDLWVKRDDLSGFALGGNKVRKLEFLIGDVLASGCDTVVTTGGTQSNHARLTAAACLRHGLSCHLVLDRGRHPENGNLLLDDLFGATIHVVEDSDPAVAGDEMMRVAAELRSVGRQPYIIPRGGSIPQGAVGYAAMVLEMEQQVRELEVSPDWVYVATGSGGTHSGIMAGKSMVGASWEVRGISVSRATEIQEAKVLELSNNLLDWLGEGAAVTAESVSVDDRFAGPAYGEPTAGTWEAIVKAGRTEALVLDPVYTGKAFAGLLSHASEGKLPAGSTVVFVHTGGSPALFAYSGEAPFARTYD